MFEIISGGKECSMLGIESGESVRDREGKVKGNESEKDDAHLVMCMIAIQVPLGSSDTDRSKS